MLKRSALLVSIVCAQIFLTASTGSAQNEPGRLSLTPFVGGYTFDNSQDLKTKPVYGLRLGYDYTRSWGVEAVVDYVATKSDSGLGNANAYGYRIEGLYNILPESRLVPFLAAGIGGNTVDYPDGTGKGTKTRAVLDYGVGLKYFVSDVWAIRGDFRHILIADKLDSPIGNFEYTVGLSYYLGGTKAAAVVEKDSDGDGVNDSLDKCPGTPKGAAVDSTGCPLDSDGDGVYDYLDKCPDTPKGAAVDRTGCPLDSDGDGVYDYMDKCPDTPKGVKVDKTGCPLALDSDGDGVYDNLDKCPDTPKGVTVDNDGCPLDSDSDGVYDYMDKCPNTPKGAAVDKTGCLLDSDGDGVYDYLDKCPDTPKGVKVDKNGCPPVIENKSMRLEIEFDTDKADIKPKYFDEIKKVADLMIAHPEINVEIQGHTDNVGSEKHNRQLSQRRADSVKKYLVEKFGISPDRLTAVGHGPSRPVADNATAAGRQKNRRIEAVINYTVTR